MDAAEHNIGTDTVKDPVGERCQKLFQDFLEEYAVEGDLKYLPDAQELIRPERNTLSVSFEDVERHNQQLATTIKLTFEEYKQISHMFVFYMRKQEEEADEDSAGTRRSELVNWYLKEMESEIETEAELNERKILAEKVITRLTNVDHVIIQLEQTGLQQRNKNEEQTLVREDDPILVVHPNYVIDMN